LHLPNLSDLIANRANSKDANDSKVRHGLSNDKISFPARIRKSGKEGNDNVPEPRIAAFLLSNSSLVNTPA
jgi:hypothetical protein